MSGTPGSVVLPHSRIIFSGSTFSWNMWGKNLEGKGIEPDFYLPTGNGLEKALKFLKKRL
jgi:hypothetical protein